jgi:hypothetical protein
MRHPKKTSEFDTAESWIEEFIRLQHKELHDEDLSDAERRFLAKVDLMAELIPGHLEDELVRYGLEAGAASVPAGRIAAATSNADSEIHQKAQQAIQEGQESISFVLEEGQLLTIKVDPEGYVQPCFLEGWTFHVARRGGDLQTVDEYGSIYLMVEDLRTMELTWDASQRQIWLQEKKS